MIGVPPKTFCLFRPKEATIQLTIVYGSTETFTYQSTFALLKG